jgi:hypothetical protein
MSLLADALDDDASHQALVNLRSARKKNRVRTLDAFDAFYKAYVTALLSAVGVYAAAGAFGDELLTASELRAVRLDGPAWLGLLVAFAVAVGLRSGGRGGPMAFERADVRHVLLAPVDRRFSIRLPALRQLRYIVFLGATVGAAAGLVAMRRMPERPVEWIATMALFGMGVAALAYGAAMVAGGYRIRPWMADLFSVALLGWSIADIYFETSTWPGTFLGQIVVWPLSFEPLAFIGLAAAAFVATWGILLVNRSSIEAAERRSRLVGQLRFAATLQDVRTVMVLQRQLAQEHMRQKPWFRLPKPRRVGLRKGKVQRRVFIRRGLQGMLRWPFMRLVRLLVFVALASASVAGVWSGTSALVVVAGIAMYLAALDLCEPLAQEIDHPDRTKTMATIRGVVLVQHMFVPFVVMIVLAIVGAVPFLVWGDAAIVGAYWPLFVLVAGTALGGAAMTINAQPPQAASIMETPETASIKFLWRMVVPPAIAVAGFLPIVAAANSWSKNHDIEKMVSDSNTLVMAAIALMVLSLTGLRYADEFRDALATSFNPPSTGDTKDDKTGKPDTAEKVAKANDKPGAGKPASKQASKSKTASKKSNKKKGRK